MQSEQGSQLESALRWKIHEIDSTRDYGVSIASGFGGVRYNLYERGMRGAHLLEKTEEEILQWVNERR